jgi:hypothetical protein
MQAKDVQWKPSNQPIAGIYCGIPKGKTKSNGWNDLSCDDNSIYNSETVTRLLLNGGLDTTSKIINNVNGRSISLVAVQPSYAQVLLAGNETAANFKDALKAPGTNAFHSAAQQFNNMIDYSTKNKDIQSVAFMRTDTVTFGKPIVETAAEAQLKIPKQVSDNYDVYLIQLAMTWRELPRTDLDELGFSVKTPADTIALSLMPLRYGEKVEVKEGTHPTLGVEAGGVKVELGELYGRDISFSYLKPTIQAYGLQESQFSWTMRDQAIQPGAEQFLCAVGVPRHSKELTLAISAFARWSAGWASAAGIESSEEKLTKIPLQ